MKPKHLTAEEAAELDSLLHSSQFDALWYMSKFPDVARCEMRPEYHFYFYGGLMERPAGPDFDKGSHADVIRPSEGNQIIP